MKSFLFAVIAFFFAACTQPHPDTARYDYAKLLRHFVRNCSVASVRSYYGELCLEAQKTEDAKAFFQENFTLERIEERGLLTGYFEPLLYGSRSKSARYRYPVYAKPNDLLHVNLSRCGKSRLRGRMERGKIVDYYDRAQINARELNASVICYVADRIERFFLEVQGSGKVALENGEIINIGYADQNGHPYRSIGKEMIARGIFDEDNVSLAGIAAYLRAHPKEVNGILHVNPSFIFFQERKTGATGALGVVLTPFGSAAVDTRYIPLGSIVSIRSPHYDSALFAEDVGGAIKGAARIDLFVGSGKSARSVASSLKEEVAVWVWRVKDGKE